MHVRVVVSAFRLESTQIRRSRPRPQCARAGVPQRNCTTAVRAYLIMISSPLRRKKVVRHGIEPQQTAAFVDSDKRGVQTAAQTLSPGMCHRHQRAIVSAIAVVQSTRSLMATLSFGWWDWAGSPGPKLTVGV